MNRLYELTQFFSGKATFGRESCRRQAILAYSGKVSDKIDKPENPVPKLVLTQKRNIVISHYSIFADDQAVRQLTSHATPAITDLTGFSLLGVGNNFRVGAGGDSISRDDNLGDLAARWDLIHDIEHCLFEN